MIFYPSRIPDPGAKKHRIRIRNYLCQNIFPASLIFKSFSDLKKFNSRDTLKRIRSHWAKKICLSKHRLLVLFCKSSFTVLPSAKHCQSRADVHLKKLKKEILFLVVVLKTLPTKEAVEALGTKVNSIQLPQSKDSNFVTLLNRRISRPNPRTFALVAEIINIDRV